MDTNNKETKVLLPDPILIPQQHTAMRILPESVLEDYKSSSSPCSPVVSDVQLEPELDSGQKLELATLDKKLGVEDCAGLMILADACELVASSTPSVVREEHILDDAIRLIPIEIKWKRRRLSGAYENSEPPADSIDDFRCKHCDRTFTSYQALGGHMTSHNRVMKNSADHDHDQLSSKFKSGHQPDLPREFNALYSCNTCGRHFPSSQALGGHRSRNCKEVNTCSSAHAAKPRHDLVLRCHFCSAVFTRYSSCLDHLSSSHPNHANNDEVGHRQDQSNHSAHTLFTGRAENKSEHQTETHKAFPTGQALGGHQRLHYKGPTEVAPAEISHEQSRARKQVEFDLNEIPAMEDEDEKESQV